MLGPANADGRGSSSVELLEPPSHVFNLASQVGDSFVVLFSTSPRLRLMPKFQ